MGFCLSVWMNTVVVFAQLAAAGFFHCPTDQEPDATRCFVCHKELDGWEPTDIPL